MLGYKAGGESNSSNETLGTFVTCSFMTTFPRKSSRPFSFLASLIILTGAVKCVEQPLFVYLVVYRPQRTVPSQTVEVGFEFLQFLRE